ncbi:MAG: hypothetical protein JXM69_01585 [Anaerolineae bacterium]|nr:hypothetical protein [Anaerolineae bacterium]
MQIITNTNIIESRSKWAKRISPVAMLVLLGGFLLNLFSFKNPEYTQYVFLLLMVGFVLAIVSSYLVNRWVREPRADQVLTTTLKKFGKEYVLFNYTTTPPHILITPSRLYVIVVKRQSGQITVRGDKFSRKFSLGRFFRFFAEEGLGVPTAEAENGRGKLKKLLGQQLTGEELPEVSAFIVFIDPNVNLTVIDPVVPIMRTNEIKSFLRQHDRQKVISAALKNQLVEIIGGKYAGEEMEA